MEFGNIGNYYVVEPFFKEIRRVFPDAEIVTTLQMSDEFCSRQRIFVVSMDLYYQQTDEFLSSALEEYAIAQIFYDTGSLIKTTGYIDLIRSSDLVIDFSGDIWGLNADLVGDNRFIIGLLKNRVAQLLDKPTAMLAGSPGPFANNEVLPFAKQVYSNFNLVTNRENLSTELLAQAGFDMAQSYSFACPSFLFEGTDKFPINIRSNKESAYIGFTISGWNMKQGPFDRWPRDDSEYEVFRQIVSELIKETKGRVYLFSHTNGFTTDPTFQLTQGRDFPIIKQLYETLDENIKRSVTLLDSIYTPSETRSLICQFDMLISGRLHGAIAGLSQNIPAVIIDYGHEPKAHKLHGFAQLLDLGDYVVDPNDVQNMIKISKSCWRNRTLIKNQLSIRVPEIRALASRQFDLLKTIV
jgi:colanic acid/amylovoran biosynthesis protein